MESLLAGITVWFELLGSASPELELELSSSWRVLTSFVTAAWKDVGPRIGSEKKNSKKFKPVRAIIAFGQPFNVSRRRAPHEGKPKPRWHLFSLFRNIWKQMRPRFEFAFVPCPATGNVDRLDKCYYRLLFYLYYSYLQLWRNSRKWTKFGHF